MKGSKIARWVILFYVVIAIFHPFIANDEALLGGAYSAPVPYSAASIDTGSSFSPPLSGGHLLGTDILGRDVLAGIMNGTEIAVKIGFISVFFAALIAIILGLFTSYCHRFSPRVSALQAIFLVLSLVTLGYLGWVAWYVSFWYFFLPFLFLFGANVALWKYTKSSSKRIIIPVDYVYLRIVEAMKAIPLLILLLALVSVFENFSVNALIWILAMLMWPGLSRYVRAEALKVLSQDYVAAARGYGASGFRILWKHVLPKLYTSLSVILAFSISSAILVESTLSFLGLGVPIDQVSWGSMLKEAQNNISAWWLAVFPGIALFGLILSLNIMGEKRAQ